MYVCVWTNTYSQWFEKDLQTNFLRDHEHAYKTTKIIRALTPFMFVQA